MIVMTFANTVYIGMRCSDEDMITENPPSHVGDAMSSASAAMRLTGDHSLRIGWFGNTRDGVAQEIIPPRKDQRRTCAVDVLLTVQSLHPLPQSNIRLAGASLL